MEKNIFEKILHLSREGTLSQRKIANFLLNHPQYKIIKIVQLANKFETSIATISRFVNALGYPFFKAFIDDWNEQMSATAENKIYNFEFKNKEIGKQIAKHVKNHRSIFIVHSERTKGAALFLQDGLAKKAIKAHIYHPESLNNKNILPNSLLIILSLSGQSKKIEKLFAQSACSLKNETKFTYLYLSLQRWKKSEPNTNFYQFIIPNQNWQIHSFDDLFHSLVHLVKIFYYVFAYL